MDEHYFIRNLTCDRVVKKSVVEDDSATDFFVKYKLK